MDSDAKDQYATQDMKKVTLNLPSSLWREVRICAAWENETLTDTIRRWLQEKVSEHPATSGKK